MNSKRLRDLLGGLRHPSGSDLLMYLEGELSSRRSRYIQDHLHSCWPCRQQSDQIARAIMVFMECRNAEVDQAPPRHGWCRFPELLRLAAKEDLEPGPVQRLLDRLPRLKFAVAAGVLAGLLVWLHLSPVDQVSANSLLDRAEAAEFRVVQGVSEPVLYQSIEVRCQGPSAAAEQPGLIESWTDLQRRLSRRRTNAACWPELERVLQINHMGSQHLLSGAAFREWRNSLDRPSDNVFGGKLGDGTQTLTLQTLAGGGAQADSILEANLVVRTSDWLPVRERLRVGAGSKVREYELARVSAKVTPRSALDPTIFATAPAAPLAAAPAPPAPVGAVPLPEAPPAEIEVRALYVLHQLHACLGENIEVIRNSNGRVLVQGTVETQERKEQLIAALASVQAAELRITTFAEAVSAGAPTPPARVVEDRTAESGTAPIEAALKGQLGGSRIIDLANQAISLSEDWEAEAWALRKVADALRPEELASLSAAGRQMLADMVRDHARALQEKIAQCRAEFQPYQSAASGVPSTAEKPLEWPGSARDLIEAAHTAARITRSFCAGSGGKTGESGEILRTLSSSLVETQARAIQLETEAATLLQTDSATESANQKR